MIFVTVGTQLPFDRMTRTIDQWAGVSGRGGDVFAQIGPSQYRPQHIDWAPFISAEECRRRSRAARLIIAHAGMGSIITALELAKPILVMPRRAALGEQRNDHQMATARHFREQGRIAVAMDEGELFERLDQLEKIRPAEQISPHASSALLQTLRRFIVGGMVAPRPVLVGEARAFQSDLDAEFAPHAGNAPALVNS